MKCFRTTRAGAASAFVALLAAGGGHPAQGENIDPGGAMARFAWGENVGWFNAEPLGDGGPGLQVDDFEVTGWMWAENLGWVSASCKNTGTCGTVYYGIRNDGAGTLSGFAWAENAGWINFGPIYGGVRIEPATGIFGGFAWGENIGWVNFEFGAAGIGAYRVQTGWFCDPAGPAPAGAPLLNVAAGSESFLSWSPAAGATGHDVVFGDLHALAATGGDFSAATTGCAMDNYTLASLSIPDALAPGQGVWFNVRGVNCSGSGTYDTGSPSQVGSRDEEILASMKGCP